MAAVVALGLPPNDDDATVVVVAVAVGSVVVECVDFAEQPVGVPPHRRASSRCPSQCRSTAGNEQQMAATSCHFDLRECADSAVGID